ncbi:TlpA family protein disulfide reductase [Siminovitchia acidinfaciens]|uniref:TlpA family protein disulfide reductase n=1 Tax=Siminovitchia acidinfaciens TaxID=2321395 RepID=A0A429Y6V1_9BACI|nr:TlpA disulfide reductase family protein [Siminovitchia acidinfaciens]RST77125.1 TlpA family protein disulfide reductase [Siminovitchia acidinfaciens]
MNKNFLSVAIIILAIAIVAVNLWKPVEKEASKDKSNTETEEVTSEDENVPGVDLSQVKEGKLAPDFELATLSGETVKLSDYRGKKVILNFWATWCPPCRAEMPHMQSFYEKNKDKGIEIVAVNLTSMDNGKMQIDKFKKEYGLTFDILLDEDGDIGMQYQAFTIPTSYIIDTNGKIAQKIVGPMDEPTMESLTNEIE